MFVGMVGMLVVNGMNGMGRGYWRERGCDWVKWVVNGVRGVVGGEEGKELKG